MPTLTDLLPLLPIFVASMFGAWSQDFIITFTPQGRIDKYFTRIARVIIGTVSSTALVGLGGATLFPTMDWKLSLLFAFILGFVGFRIATVFAKTLAGLELFGMKNVADAVKIAEAEIDEKDELEKLRKEIKEINENTRSKNTD